MTNLWLLVLLAYIMFAAYNYSITSYGAITTEDHLWSALAVVLGPVFTFGIIAWFVFDSVSEVWNRMCQSIEQCPHEERLLDTLYRTQLTFE